jgi:hypothetical protein
MSFFMSLPQQLEPVVLVIPAALDVEAIGVVEPPRLAVQGLGRIGEVTIGLTPPLLSSVASRGIVPIGATPGAEPVVDPPRAAVGFVVPDAVPPPQDEADDVPVVSVAMPAPSKVEPDPLMPLVEMPIPVPAQGSVLAVGASGIGLNPPGNSSVAPSGTPTAPADDVAPGMPSGEVAPIAGDVGVSGAI